MIPLRTVVRTLLAAALASAAWMLVVASRAGAPAAAPFLAGVALLACAPAVPILALRWVTPRRTAMMLTVRARLRRAAGAAGRDALVTQWTPLEQIARDMWLAAIAAEDGAFRWHSGFDWESLREAYAHNQTHAQKRGGSTITQQVAKNLFLWPGRSYVRKSLEAYLTMLIEALWPKRRILEVYLNIAQLGPDLFGVEAAARRYFGKPAARLDLTEAALLAATLPNPAHHRADAPTHQLRFRQAWILSAARRLGDEYLEGL